MISTLDFSRLEKLEGDMEELALIERILRSSNLVQYLLKTLESMLSPNIDLLPKATASSIESVLKEGVGGWLGELISYRC